MRDKLKSRSRIKESVKYHIEQNLKEYGIVTLIFFVGIIIGVIFINNISEADEGVISNYINNFINGINDGTIIDFEELLRKTIFSNLFLVLILWISGCTVIGMPVLYGTIAFRGFSFGFTISALIAVLGSGKGLAYGISACFLQNLVFIPALFAISVSGIKLYKSIMENRRKENIKLEILRHSVFSAICSIALILSAFIETYISSNIFLKIVKII